jgi:double-stranded uracil-DNA glycosylase
VRDEGGVEPRTFTKPANWMGERVLTLADVWPERPRAMTVGLNPAPSSVEVGHYYQGRSGQRQLLHLADAGLFRRPEPGSTYFEAVALDAGVGFTDVVKRPTRGEKDVHPREIEFGRAALNTALAARDVPLVICVFRHPVVALLGTSGEPGFRMRPTIWGARVFRMPGPFAPTAEVGQTMAELSKVITAR